MTASFVFFSNVAAGSLRIAVCLFLIRRVLSTGKPAKKSAAVAFIGAVVTSVVLTVAGLPDLYRMASEAVWAVVCAVRLYGADTRMSLFLGIFYEIAVGFWQFLFAAWLGVLFRSLAFLDCGTKSGQLAVWAFHALLAVLALCFSRSRNVTWKGAFRFVLAVALAGFLAVVTLSEQTVLKIADDTLDMWTILSIVLMMAVLTYNMSMQYEMEKELARLKSEQAELLERDYTTLNNAYAINAKLFHDFHNHIGVLRQLLSHDKTEEAVRYLDELQAPVREMTDTVWTGDETVDYLLNSKAAIAENSGIQMQIQVEFPRHTNLRSVDMCAILGNLLDNALEAAGQAPKPDQRLIRLTIRRINQMLVIKAENSFAVWPVERDGTFATTKKDGGLHGWGLKSARTAAAKYEGTVQTSCAGNLFRAVVTLSFQ